MLDSLSAIRAYIYAVRGILIMIIKSMIYDTIYETVILLLYIDSINRVGRKIRL